MGRDVIEYMESPRRKALEKQYRESVARKVEDKLVDKLACLTKQLRCSEDRLANIEKSILILSAEVTRLAMMLGGRDGDREGD